LGHFFSNNFGESLRSSNTGHKAEIDFR
jgi:hypothetical protein